MGVIARSAAALGADALLVDPSSCDPLYRRAVRASMGQIFALAHTRLPDLPDGFAELRRAGFEMLALTPGADADDIGDLEVGPRDRIALVLGAEGPGISGPVLAACDRRVRIPMSAGVDSLNVGVAAGVACFAMAAARSRHVTRAAEAQ
jgi:tRNA G18 (ribose-2'-O)-methylase SpoU